MKWTLAGLAGIFFSCSSPSTEPVMDQKKLESDNSWMLLPFVKVDSVNPVMTPGTGTFMCPVRKQQVSWEGKDVFNPAVVVRNKRLYMLYRAEDSVGTPAGTSRIGLAESDDGEHFTRHEKPVLYPDNDPQKKYEWEGGCEDPRVVEDGAGIYYMMYTAFDGTTARLMVASSPDLVHWKKHGPAFAKAYKGKYLDKWSKSGSVVSTYRNGKIIATKLNGKYWMYWGDQNIWIANSTDLVNWTPVEMQAGDKPLIPLRGQSANMPALKIVVPTRTGHFDSDLVESGPPAMITVQGILLIYNGRNASQGGDSSLPEGTYAAGQVLLDQTDPSRIIRRMDNYFIKPDKPYELSGQVNKVCFLEGLVQFRSRWLLYYGTADSKIALAAKK
ncbi:MAG TPA: glycoside hydrolase family 130 protein [Puia sp.]|nr:glycoside hydrolase family 130 protein [Puia sp.]